MSEDPKKVVELFHGEPRERKERNAVCDQMERCAGIMAQNFADDLAGYIIIGVNRAGGWSLGSGVTNDAACFIGSTALAGLGIAAINRDMLAESQIKDALIRNGLVQPPPGEKA